MIFYYSKTPRPHHKILTLLLVLNQVRHLQCFASWFMATCLIDLWDEHEIIMGHRIVPAVVSSLSIGDAGALHSSSEMMCEDPVFFLEHHQQQQQLPPPAVSLQVLDFDSRQEIVPIVRSRIGKSRASSCKVGATLSPVAVDGGPSSKKEQTPVVDEEEGLQYYKQQEMRFYKVIPLVVDGNERKFTFLVQVQMSPSLKKECPNFQYVLDAKAMSIAEDSSRIFSHDVGDDEKNQTSPATIWMATPRFLSKRNGCNGRRAYGIINSENKEQVVDSDGLLMEITVSLHHNHDTNKRGDIEWKRVEDVHEDDVVGVQLVTGWACGKEAVKLTEPIYFVHEVPDGDSNNDRDIKNMSYPTHDEEL